MEVGDNLALHISACESAQKRNGMMRLFGSPFNGSFLQDDGQRIQLICACVFGVSRPPSDSVLKHSIDSLVRQAFPRRLLD
jgi:hypothetical protein